MSAGRIDRRPGRLAEDRQVFELFPFSMEVMKQRSREIIRASKNPERLLQRMKEKFEPFLKNLDPLTALRDPVNTKAQNMEKFQRQEYESGLEVHDKDPKYIKAQDMKEIQRERGVSGSDLHVRDLDFIKVDKRIQSKEFPICLDGHGVLRLHALAGLGHQPFIVRPSSALCLGCSEIFHCCHGVLCLEEGYELYLFGFAKTQSNEK